MGASAGGIRAGRAYVELGVKDGATKALNAVGAKFKSLGTGMAAVGGSLVAAGSAITGPLMAAASVFNTMGSEMADMSARTGQSVETLSKLKYAAEQSGAGVGDLEKALRVMAKKGMKADELGKVADYIAGISDPAKKSAEAMRLLGKGGAALLPMLNGGAAGLAKFGAEAEGLGLVMSSEDASAADDFGDSLDQLKSQLKMLTFQVGAPIAAALGTFLDYVKPIVSAAISWAKNNRALIGTIFAVAAGLTAIGTVIAIAGGGVAAIGAAIGLIVPVISAIGAAFMFAFSPIGVLIGVAAAAAYIFRDSILELLAPLADVWAFAVESFQGIADAIKGGDISLAMKILGLSLKQAWNEVLQKMTGAWLAFKESLVMTWISAVDALKQAWVRVYSAIAKGIAWIYAKLTGQDAEQMMRFVSEDESTTIEKYKQEALAAKAEVASATDSAYQDEMAALEAERAALNANKTAALNEARSKADTASQKKKAADIKKVNLPDKAPKLATLDSIEASSPEAWKRVTENTNNIAQAQFDVLKSIDTKLDNVDLVLNEAEEDV